METEAIKKIIHDICLELFIPEPMITYIEEFPESKTMRMGITPDGTILTIKKGLMIDADFIFDLAHELRHIWQIHEGLLTEYIPRTSASLEEYNQQSAEVDAHAYAALFMEINFGLRPLFQCFYPETARMITDRMEEIKRDEYEEF